MLLLFITTIGSILGVLLIPKRISILEMYTSSVFATFLAALADMYLDVKLDYYGFFDKGVDYEYILIFIVIYPAFSIVVVNFYPYRKSLMKKCIYILGISLLTTLFEYISLYTKVFYHNEWKLWYSALCYPVLYLVLVLQIKFVRKYH